MGMQILGIFIGILFLWTVVDLVWPSLLAIVAFGLSDYCTMSQAVNACLGSTTVWMQMMLMLLSDAINRSGMGEIIARWIITRKFLNGKPYLFTFVYLFGFFVVSTLVGCFAAVLLSWAIFYNICDIVGMDKRSKYSKIMLNACMYVSTAGLSLTPFQSYVLALCNAFNASTGATINYALFMLMAFVANTLLLLLLIVVLRYAVKCDLSALVAFDVNALSKDDMKKPDYKQLSYLGGFVLIIVYVFTKMLVPADTAFGIFLVRIGNEGVFGVIIAILCLIRVKNEPLMNFAENSKTGMNWYCLLMCAAVVPIAGALTSEGTGVTQFLAPVFTPIFGDMNGNLFLILTMLIILVLTNIMSNIGVVMLLIPIVTPFIASTGVSAQLLAFSLIATTNMGIILPGASGLSPYLYSNEYLEKKDIYKYCGVLTLLYAIASAVTLVVFNMFVR